MTGYIRSLREIVGTRPLLQIGASVIVENSAGEILLQLRRDNGCWGYPGGSAEPGETMEEVAKRELFEETGLVAEELSLFTVFSGPEAHYVYPNGDEVYNVDVNFRCTRFHGTLRPDGDEVEALQFFPVDGLPDRFSSLFSSPNHPLRRYLAWRRAGALLPSETMIK